MAEFYGSTIWYPAQCLVELNRLQENFHGYGEDANRHLMLLATSVEDGSLAGFVDIDGREKRPGQSECNRLLCTVYALSQHDWFTPVLNGGGLVPCVDHTLQASCSHNRAEEVNTITCIFAIDRWIWLSVTFPLFLCPRIQPYGDDLVGLEAAVSNAIDTPRG